MDSLETEEKHVEKDIDLINGSFSLLFTGGATETSEREREAKEGQIGSLLTKVTGSSSSMKKVKTKNAFPSSSSKNFQIIDLASERVENRADLLLFNRIPVSVRIFGSCVINNATPSSFIDDASEILGLFHSREDRNRGQREDSNPIKTLQCPRLD